MQTNIIYNEDCLETMKRMEDGSIDLTVTSPPYDDLRTYKGKVGDVEDKYNGYSFAFEDIAKELYRVTKDGGVVVWVVGDAIINGSESGNSFRQALYFKEVGFNIHDTMIYEKAGPRFPEKIRYSQIFEYMFVLSKGKPNTVSILKDRKNKWAGHTNWGHGGHRLKNGEMLVKEKAKPYAEYGARFNIWRYSNGFGFGTKDKESYGHPAMFPEKLAEDHIVSWSKEGEVVYDPFMGSGTTAKMAKLNNRLYIGSELNEEYYNLSVKRLQKLDEEKKETA
jgi:site-specific DNA-methyltransferase (adenine-specific)